MDTKLVLTKKVPENHGGGLIGGQEGSKQNLIRNK